MNFEIIFNYPSIEQNLETSEALFRINAIFNLNKTYKQKLIYRLFTFSKKLVFK